MRLWELWKTILSAVSKFPFKPYFALVDVLFHPPNQGTNLEATFALAYYSLFCPFLILVFKDGKFQRRNSNWTLWTLAQLIQPSHALTGTYWFYENVWDSSFPISAPAWKIVMMTYFVSMYWLIILSQFHIQTSVDTTVLLLNSSIELEKTCHSRGKIESIIYLIFRYPTTPV